MRKKGEQLKFFGVLEIPKFTPEIHEYQMKSKNKALVVLNGNLLRSLVEALAFLIFKKGVN